MSKKTLQESIESEMSGTLQHLLVAVGEKPQTSWTKSCTFEAQRLQCSCFPVKCVKNVPAYFAERLFSAMKVKRASPTTHSSS